MSDRESRSSGWLGDASLVARGVLMGAADVVPGVSGGTVALIVGVYDRLVASLSSVDRELVDRLLERKWREAARRIDLRFLAALGSGIACGVVAFGGLINRLLSDPSTRGFTRAAFFGMILASTLLVARLVGARTPSQWIKAALHAALGAAAALALTSLPEASVEPSLAYLFLCGYVAICAMILPGVSGAYLLLVLGVYVYVTDILKRAPTLELTPSDAAVVVVFAAGCLCGLISFSKLLKWLLRSHRAGTMAALCGCMLGAIHRVWPLQRLAPGESAADPHAVYLNQWPSDGAATVGCAVVALLAFAAVVLIDRFVDAHSSDSLESEPPTAERP